MQQTAAVHDELLRWAFWLPMAQYLPTLEAAGGSASEELRRHIDRLDAGCTLAELPRAAEQVMGRIFQLLETVAEDGDHSGNADWPGSAALTSICQAAKRAALAAREQRAQIADLRALCRQFWKMDFRFLFHPRRKLFSIGFQVSENRRDNSYYDLLASEARLTSFLAVSHRQLSLDHWFALGRTMTLAEGRPVLLSWSGTMFEYLMPILLMPSCTGTLLDASCQAAVRRQIRYMRRQGLPWGISESCYNRTDERQTYQYRAHGVPGLGMKRGLGEDLVVAPGCNPI